MNQNNISKLNLEPDVRDLKQQGHTVRDISRKLTELAHVPITSSAVFRYIKKTQVKQKAKPELNQKNSTLSTLTKLEVKQDAQPKIKKITFKKTDDSLEVQRPWTYWR